MLQEVLLLIKWDLIEVDILMPHPATLSLDVCSYCRLVILIAIVVFLFIPISEALTTIYKN
jgi:hypothetical protein